MYSSSINVVSFHVSSWVSVIWANKKGSFSQFVRGPSPPRSIVQRFLEHPSSHVVSAAYDLKTTPLLWHMIECITNSLRRYALLTTYYKYTFSSRTQVTSKHIF